MCLTLKCKSNPKLPKPTLKFVNGRVFCYKVMQIHEPNIFVSSFQAEQYIVNKIKESNRKACFYPPKLSKEELKFKEVLYGLHFFINQEDAEQCLATRMGTYFDEVIAKFTCRREDLITTGFWSDYNHYPQVVFNKARLIGKVNYKEQDYKFIQPYSLGYTVLVSIASEKNEIMKRQMYLNEDLFLTPRPSFAFPTFMEALMSYRKFQKDQMRY